MKNQGGHPAPPFTSRGRRSGNLEIQPKTPKDNKIIYHTRSKSPAMWNKTFQVLETLCRISNSVLKLGTWVGSPGSASVTLQPVGRCVRGLDSLPLPNSAKWVSSELICFQTQTVVNETVAVLLTEH